jgi:hypothetical protein
MNKKLLFTICIITLSHYASNHTSSSMILPQDETGVWKWSPFRMASHAVWGTKLGQDFWESNSTELSTALAQFKNSTNDDEKTKILKRVMENSANAYQKVIDTLQSNYRSTMSYIVEQFQNASPDSTILYFPDHKLVGMYKKNAPDEEKAQVMFKLLQETKKAMDAKKSKLPISTSDSTPANIPPVTVNVHPGQQQPQG